MTDRELLEKAAKAAGIELIRWNDGEEPYSSGEGFILEDNRIWNPARNCGQALQLAADLRLHIGLESHAVCVWHPKWHGSWSTAPIHEGDDPGPPTCLAITRAAAAIGEGKSHG